MQELAASIKDRGILQPLLVEECDDGCYILHAGERRLRAAGMAGLTVVPAQVLPPLNGTGKRERIMNACVENMMRQDMTAVEEAHAIHQLRQLGLSNTEIWQKTGVNINTIAHRLLILDLEPELQALVGSGQLPRDGRAIKALLSVADSETRIKLGSRLARPGVTISTIVNACAKLNEHVAQRQSIESESTPMIGLSGATKQSTAALKWQTVRSAAQGMCDKCDVKASLPKVPEPAWLLIISSARAVCDGCSLRANAANLDMCRQCPGVDLLKRLVVNV
jgi:ParB/RepB/Spo0J family partition protein